MPRSPHEGAATRGQEELDIAARRSASTRDRRVRSGTDRRRVDHGPPAGIPDRRVHQRRSHDRREHPRSDRRLSERRSSESRRGTSDPRHLIRTVQPRPVVAPAIVRRRRRAKIVRGIVVLIVAVACLLAATLKDTSPRGASITPPAAHTTVAAQTADAASL